VEILGFLLFLMLIILAIPVSVWLTFQVAFFMIHLAVDYIDYTATMLFRDGVIYDSTAVA
jgi:hypothetical protein